VLTSHKQRIAYSPRHVAAGAPPSAVARRIARDLATAQRGRSPKAIAAVLRQYLNAADVSTSPAQFDGLVFAIADGTIR
jgi:hypothetical protein